MARRKRASMREGPLADLFRSTTRSEAEEAETKQEPLPPAAERTDEATRVMRDERAPRHREPEPEEAERGAPPPDPERVRAYRVEEHSAYEPAAREPRERLSRIFGD